MKALNIIRPKSVSFYDFTYIGQFLLKFIFIRLNKNDLRPHSIFYVTLANVLIYAIAGLANAISNILNGTNFFETRRVLWYCMTQVLAITKICEIVLRNEWSIPKNSGGKWKIEHCQKFEKIHDFHT